MSIRSIEIAKELRKEGERLGRDGLSQRVDQLVLAFAKDNPTGNYREGIMLAGRLHAIFLATDPNDYWREVAERGFTSERWDLRRFEKAKEAPDGR
jgi:hypothetical protein